MQWIVKCRIVKCTLDALRAVLLDVLAARFDSYRLASGLEEDEAPVSPKPVRAMSSASAGGRGPTSVGPSINSITI